MPLRRRRYGRRRPTFRRRRFGRRRILRGRRRRSGRRSRRASRPELKVYDKTAITANYFYATSFGAYNITPAIVLGNDVGQRVGRSIVVRKLQFWVEVYQDAAPLIPFETARLVIWRERTTLLPTAWTDLYDFSFQPEDAARYAPRWPGGNPNFSIVYDKPFNLCPGTQNSRQFKGPVQRRRITLRWRRGLRVNYPSGGAYVVGDSEKLNTLMYGFLGEGGPIQVPVAKSRWRIWYTDV